MSTDSPNYHAFLLRLWRENGRSPWRVSVEYPHNSEKKLFVDLEQFWAYMQEEIGMKTAVVTVINREEQESMEDTIL